MNRVILWIIKGGVIFVVAAAIGVSKDLGFPYALGMLIGVAIITTVWRYNPNSKKESEPTELRKD